MMTSNKNYKTNLIHSTSELKPRLTLSNNHHHPNHYLQDQQLSLQPTLPPTPPASIHSSPPPLNDSLHTFQSQQQQQQQTPISVSIPSSIQLQHDPSPTRRHQYPMPTTPGVQQFSQFSQFSTSSHYNQDGYNQSTSPHSHWDGTLSSKLAKSIHKLKTQTLDFPLSYQLKLILNSPTVQTQFKSILSSKLRFVLLCSLWYTSSAISSNTGKIILNQFKFPITLTIVQFGFVAIWSCAFIYLTKGFLNYPKQNTIKSTLIMSLFSIAGHVFSSMAISRVPVSTVHTIKALSPLFTVLAYGGLFGVKYGFMTYFSLLPLTLGVMLTCSFDLNANLTGFLCALGSTIIFVSQNIYGKKLLPQESDEELDTNSMKLNGIPNTTSATKGKVDKLNLLFYSSTIAFILMIPIWIWFDLFKLWSSTNYNLNRTMSHQSLIFYFIFNGSIHFLQCILAFSILSRTSPVTYSIASLIKRISVICLAIFYFDQSLSLLQSFGMVLTFFGLYLYNLYKFEIDLGEKKLNVINSIHSILPSTKEDVKTFSKFS